MTLHWPPPDDGTEARRRRAVRRAAARAAADGAYLAATCVGQVLYLEGGDVALLIETRRGPVVVRLTAAAARRLAGALQANPLEGAK